MEERGKKLWDPFMTDQLLNKRGLGIIIKYEIKIKLQSIHLKLRILTFCQLDLKLSTQNENRAL